jgi:predicted nuclease of predicted toxin-antitoxin system
MKLVLDGNLSPKLPRLIGSRFSTSVRVRDSGLKGQPDQAVGNVELHDTTLWAVPSSIDEPRLFL